MLETFEIVAKTVADPSRARILKLLEGGELCVCQITAVLDLAPATMSKHVAALKTAGLVQQRRDGKWVYYRLAEREFNPYAAPFLGLRSRLPHERPYGKRGSPSAGDCQCHTAQGALRPGTRGAWP